MAESFFATLECELIERETFSDRSEARLAVFDYVEAFYNPHRRHSALDYQSPMTYEKTTRQENNRSPKSVSRPSQLESCSVSTKTGSLHLLSSLRSLLAT
jgi:putative transposase